MSEMGVFKLPFIKDLKLDEIINKPEGVQLQLIEILPDRVHATDKKGKMYYWNNYRVRDVYGAEKKLGIPTYPDDTDTAHHAIQDLQLQDGATINLRGQGKNIWSAVWEANEVEGAAPSPKPVSSKPSRGFPEEEGQLLAAYERALNYAENIMGKEDERAIHSQIVLDVNAFAFQLYKLAQQFSYDLVANTKPSVRDIKKELEENFGRVTEIQEGLPF